MIRLLAEARVEIFPLRGIAQQTVEAAQGRKVTVTCSARRGIEATLRLTEDLVASGLEATPHLPARLMTDRGHARRTARRLQGLGVRDVFVIGGDVKEPAGPFPSAVSLLVYLAEAGFGFDQVGVAAYPEGHPSVDESVLWRELESKQAWATYAVTQLCFDSGPIVRWMHAARSRGIGLPVHVGMAGAVDRMKLMRIALRIGVGDSARFINKNSNLVGRLLGQRSYTPDDLIEELSRAKPWPGIAGFHLYTFNEVGATVSWMREALAQR